MKQHGKLLLQMLILKKIMLKDFSEVLFFSLVYRYVKCTIQVKYYRVQYCRPKIHAKLKPKKYFKRSFLCHALLHSCQNS